MYRWLNEVAGARGLQISATRWVGHEGKRSKVRWCTAVKNVVDENGHLELDALGNMQPMNADKCIRGVVTPPKSKDKPHSCIENRLSATADWQGGLSYAVAIVHP